MADDSDAPSQDNEGLLAPTDYKLSTINIITSDGLTLDIKNLVVELDIYEDIFAPAMTGSVTLGDAGDIISNLKLHGNEYIALSVDKPTLSNPITKVFRIYKIADRSFGTTALQNYTIYFCSEELILSAQTLINKSYKGLAISTMVDDILRNTLKIDDDRLKDAFWSETAGSFDLIIPRMQPFRAIEWLTLRAYNTDQNLFFFFENRDGFNFTSYENLINQPSYATYGRNVVLTQEAADNMNTYNFLGIIHDFDVLKSLRFGAYNSALLSLDLVNRKTSTKFFGFADIPSKSLLNGNLPVNALQNRLGFSLCGTRESMVKYVISSDSDPQKNPADIQNWMPQTSSKLAQLQSFKLAMHIPGDVGIKAGAVVDLVIPRMVVQEKTTDNDDVRSGSYLVATVHHKFVLDAMTTVVGLLSDSVGVPLSQSADSEPMIQKMVSM